MVNQGQVVNKEFDSTVAVVEVVVVVTKVVVAGVISFLALEVSFLFKIKNHKIINSIKNRNGSEMIEEDNNHYLVVRAVVVEAAAVVLLI